MLSSTSTFHRTKTTPRKQNPCLNLVAWPLQIDAKPLYLVGEGRSISDGCQATVMSRLRRSVHLFSWHQIGIARYKHILFNDDRLKVETSGEVSRGEKMALRGTDPESYITEYTLVYGDISAGFLVEISLEAKCGVCGEREGGCTRSLFAKRHRASALP